MVPEILQFFGACPAGELDLMLSEFAWDSKNAAGRRSYSPACRGRGPVPASLTSLYERLTERAFSCWNLE
jgi:hypothetical protein